MQYSHIRQQLKQCCTLQLPIQGKKLHAHVIKTGLDLSGTVIPNALIQMYAKCAHLHCAVQVFDEMPTRDLASWATMFTAYNQANLHKHTLFLFSTMLPIDNLHPDHFIFSTLIKACANLAAFRLGLQLHAQFVVSSFSEDDHVKSCLVDFYAKCGFPDYGRRVFESIINKDVVGWTSLLYGYAKTGKKDEALEILHNMPCVNSHSWTALISGFVQSGRCMDSFKIFNEARRGGFRIEEPYTLSSLIAGSANLTMLELGKQYHRLVIGLGYESNLYLGNSLIDMYAKCSDVFAADKVFGSLRKRDIVSWTSMIVGMAQHGRGCEALKLYDEMTLTGIKPSAVTFTGILYACSHVGLVEKGKQLFESMVADYGIRPSLQHYTCLVDLYSRSGYIEEAEDVLSTMPFKPDEAVWSTLLSACNQRGKTEAGVRIANQLLEVRPEDPSIYVLMSNMFARASMWKSVSTVRKMMATMEVKKEPGYSLLDLGIENRVFYAGETAHPMNCDLVSLLKELDAKMRKRGYVPDTSLVLHDMELQEKERQLFWHSERVAVAYGLLKSTPGTTIRILKNLRVCGDCHTVLKLISDIVKREIIVRDASRFHLFKDGVCSCRDFW